MYDPVIGRFLQEDPIGLAGGDANFYRYCGNGPTDATDPNGLQEKPAAAPKEIPLRIVNNGVTLQGGEGLREKIKAQNGTWYLDLWREVLTAPNAEKGLFNPRTLYGGKIDAEFELDATSANMLTADQKGKKKYEIYAAKRYTLNNVLFDKPYQYQVDAKSPYEPAEVPERDRMGIMADLPRSAWASRFALVTTDADIDLLFGARCAQSKKWISAIEVRVKIWTKDDKIYIDIPWRREVNLDQAGTFLNRAEQLIKKPKPFLIP